MNKSAKEQIRPTLVIDTREQLPLTFSSLPTITGTLMSGDYSIKNLTEIFAIERKSIADLVGSVCKERERFERELHRLRGFRFARLLIVGNKEDIEEHRYRSQISPQSILASLTAFEIRYNVPVVWCSTPELAAKQIEKWAYYFAREILKMSSELTDQINYESTSTAATR
jgi:DNA excision repair protein ERCC-4